jgi:hypothetical protein
MLSCRSITLAVVISALVLGCEKHEPTPAPSNSPAATPPTSQPATTAPATTQLSQSSLLIDGRVFTFPPAKLRVSKSNGHVVARLNTIDPKAALADDYKGNGFDLVMKLDDIAEPAEIYTSVWQHNAPQSNDFVDSPYGIFLEGIRYQLQPADVSARFSGDILLVRIDLRGKFLQFDQSEPRTPGKPVYVEGRLLAPVEYKD